MILAYTPDGRKLKKWSWECVLCDKEKAAMYFGKPLCKEHWEELSGLKLEELEK